MSGRHETWFEAFAADVQANKREVTVARIATLIGKCSQTVYNQQDGVQDLTLDNLAVYAAELRTRGRSPYHLVAWLCRQARCMWAPLPEARPCIDARLPRMLSEFGDLTKALAEAMEDGRVTEAEAARVWVEGEQAISAILGAMHAARGMAGTVPLRPATMAEAEAAAKAVGDDWPAGC